MTQQFKNPITQGDDSLFNRVARIYGCARIGAAASDTVLPLDLHKGGYQEAFEAIASIADSVMGDLMDASETGDVSRMFQKWKAERAALMAYAAENDDCDSDAQYNARWADKEALGDKIANAKPTCSADAAAMLEWAMIDSDNGGISYPSYQVAYGAVAAFLRGNGV